MYSGQQQMASDWETDGIPTAPSSQRYAAQVMQCICRQCTIWHDVTGVQSLRVEQPCVTCTRCFEPEQCFIDCP